jgi:Acetyltransferase (GNAT) domain
LHRVRLMAVERSQPLKIPMQEALGKGALRASARGPFERALLARLELTAFMRAAPCLYTPSGLDEAAGGRAWWFAHRVWGMDTGLIEAGACAAGVAGVAPASCPPAWAEDLVLGGRARAVKIASLRTPGARRDETPGGESGAWSRGGLLLTSVATSFCDVLPLSDSYEAALAGFGRRTRRNIRIARRTAASGGISFSMVLGESQVPRPELRGLVARTRPFPQSPGRVGRFERYVASTGGGFHSCLRDLRGQLISYCRGFLHERTAYLIYQLNDVEWHPLSPSLLHRAHLIEALIGLGTHELIFVHGCGGLLCHACHPMPVDQIWVMRPRLPARLLTRAVAAATPGTAYRQLALQALQGSAATWEDTWR